MSSEDIQSQLPDDASRFHRIDEQFKVGSVSVNNRLTVLDTERYDFINLMVLHQHWFWFVYDVRMAMVWHYTVSQKKSCLPQRNGQYLVVVGNLYRTTIRSQIFEFIHQRERQDFSDWNLEFPQFRSYFLIHSEINEKLQNIHERWILSRRTSEILFKMFCLLPSAEPMFFSGKMWSKFGINWLDIDGSWWKEQLEVFFRIFSQYHAGKTAVEVQETIYLLLPAKIWENEIGSK